MLRGEIKLFLHPEMQMSVVIRSSLVFVVILARPLVFPALSVTSQIQMDVNVDTVILRGVGVVDWGVSASCSSNSPLEKMQLFVLWMLTTVALQNSWLICMAYTFSISTFHRILGGLGLEGTLKNHLIPTPSCHEQRHLPLDQVAQGCFH